MQPVRVKSVEQRALQGMHRIRSLWMGTRTSRINALRGFCREFGIAIPVGARTGVESISRVLADPNTAVPDLIRGTAKLLVEEEIHLLEARIAQLEREPARLAKLSPACTTLLSIPEIDLLTVTALVTATSGDVTHFKDARHFSSWFDLTPKEYSSGNRRYVGRISKKGDRYLRMLLTQGARSVLRASKVAQDAGRDACGVRRWALDVQARSNHNREACALANMLTRICDATLRGKEPFDEPAVRLSKKVTRESFAMPA
jgi:transposase